MKQWGRRVRGAIGMGILWAIGWGGFGLLIGAASVVLPWLPWGVIFKYFDAPLPALAMPGFICGALFSVVLGIAGRRHRFEDLSLKRFAAWGALGGLLLSLVPAVLVGIGQAHMAEGLSVWKITAVVCGPFMLLGAASAAGTLMLARGGRKATPVTADDYVAGSSR